MSKAVVAGKWLATGAGVVAVLAFGAFAAVPSALAAGDFDPSFATGGQFVSPLGEGTRPGASISGIAVQPDGNIVVAGGASENKVVVARLTPEGTLDQMFGTAGKLLTTLDAGPNGAPFPQGLARQSDGKIVVGGVMGDFVTQESRFLVGRVTAQGVLDSSFDGDGVVLTQVGQGAHPYSSVLALALQPDGKILAAGGASDGNGDGALLLARLDTDGGFDSSFATNGMAFENLGDGAHPDSGATAIVLQPDGKILLGGFATDTDIAQPDAVLLARLDADGKSVDSTFGNAGKVVTRLGAVAPVTTTLNALALQADGKIVVGGFATDAQGHQQFLVARLNADGKGLDAAFAGGGTIIGLPGQTGTASSAVRALALQPDGKIVAVGLASGSAGDVEVLVARLGTDGSFDPSFGDSGKVITQLGPVTSYFNAVALQPDGKVVAGGGVIDSTPDVHALVARLILDQPPTASFTAAPNPVQQNQPVAFADSGSADPDGALVSYAWDFGDGTRASGTSANHTYASAGVFAAALTVRDDYGLSATASQTITVNAPASCGAERVPRKIRRGLERASALIDRAAATEKASQRARLLDRAGNKLEKVSRAIDRAANRKRRRLSATCAAALRGEVQAAEARIAALS